MEWSAGNVGSSIEAVARQCRNALTKCVETPVLMEFEWAENRLAEFNMWAEMTGAFAGEKASLDARLALEPEIQNLVTNILILLLGSLGDCQTLAHLPSLEEPAPLQSLDNGNDGLDGSDEDEGHDATRVSFLEVKPEEIPRGFSPWSDDSDESDYELSYSEDGDENGGVNGDMTGSSDDNDNRTSEGEKALQRPKQEVDQIIDHLTRLAIAIRKSGSTSRTYKADKLFKPNDHRKLRDHLVIVVLAKGSMEGRSDYSVDPRYLTPVQQRLIKANLRRRNRYVYAQRHARKLAQEAANPRSQFAVGDSGQEDLPYMPDAQELSQVSSGRERQEQNRPAPQDDTSSQILPADANDGGAHHHGALTATSASAIDNPIEQVPRDMPAKSQVAKTNITTTTAKIIYPNPPPIKYGTRYFKCPCCAQTLPEMFRQTTMWKKHLMGDVCPYTCIVEDCPKPDVLYVTRDEWTRHVEKDHQKCWECPACRFPGRVPTVFPSVNLFIDHLVENHADTISPDMHSTMAHEAARSVPSGISSCPLCDSDGTADSPELLQHIAEHIHAFALRSLPWAKDEERSGEEDTDPTTPGDPEEEYQNSFGDDNYFDQASEDHSGNAFSESDRDSSGLESLSYRSEASSSGTLGASRRSEVSEPDPAARIGNDDYLTRDPKEYLENNPSMQLPQPIDPDAQPEVYANPNPNYEMSDVWEGLLSEMRRGQYERQRQGHSLWEQRPFGTMGGNIQGSSYRLGQQIFTPQGLYVTGDEFGGFRQFSYENPRHPPPAPRLNPVDVNPSEYTRPEGPTNSPLYRPPHARPEGFEQNPYPPQIQQNPGTPDRPSRSSRVLQRFRNVLRPSGNRDE